MASSVAPKKSTNLNIVKVLILTKYGRLGASSRLRFLQYLPSLKAVNIETTIQPLISDEVLRQRYNKGSYDFFLLLKCYFNRCLAMIKRNRFDVLWIEKEALPWTPACMELFLLRESIYALDFDDAIFHNYDLHQSAMVRFFLGKRVDKLINKSNLIIAGNEYLAQHAVTAGANWVQIIPTVIDLARYSSKNNYNIERNANVLRVVWIGSPSTMSYLKLLEKPLQRLASIIPFNLRVIGGDSLAMQDVNIEIHPWSESTESEAIAECDVGIMPLLNTPWEQGKCAYKLIQYMACGLPTVASPVGANTSVIVDGVTGFLADTDDAWVDKLELLLSDAALRKKMGDAGRERVKAHYCLQQTAPILIDLLLKLGKV